jgi:hypothetical protein
MLKNAVSLTELISPPDPYPETGPQATCSVSALLSTPSTTTNTHAKCA